MFTFKGSDGVEMPAYATTHAAGADLRASAPCTVSPGSWVRVPTGLYIASFDGSSLAEDEIAELQIRARSGLSYKHGIMLVNGVGTVDADYTGEIGVLLYNAGSEVFVVNRGDRIAQLVLSVVRRLPGLAVGGDRAGGFGSTGKT
jgi:dUTP pyrophosphatase